MLVQSHSVYNPRLYRIEQPCYQLISAMRCAIAYKKCACKILECWKGEVSGHNPNPERNPGQLPTLELLPSGFTVKSHSGYAFSSCWDSRLSAWRASLALADYRARMMWAALMLHWGPRQSHHLPCAALPFAWLLIY